MAQRQLIGTVILVSTVTLHSACAGPSDYRWGSEPVPLATTSVLAPVSPYADSELARLERMGDQPAPLLRRAYILLQNGESRHALQLANQVLYGANPPSPAEEALALYLRSEANLTLGETESAARDREKALELALDGELRKRLLAAAPEPDPPPRAAPPPAAASLTVLPRSAWQASPERLSRLQPMGRIYRLTIHHSAMNLASSSAQEAASSIQQIQRNQLRDRAWGDIGYHFMIDRAGRIWEARDTRWQGAHSKGNNNRGNLGICLLGNFAAGGEAPSANQMLTLRAFTAQLCRQYRIPVEQIHTHQEFVATECPGTWLQTQVDQMRLQMSGLAGKQ